MKLIKVSDLITKGDRSKYSATYLLSKELDLEALPVADEGKVHFTSPNFAEIIDVLTKKFQIKKMLDLFCGSGALSKIALLNGVDEVVCVDMFTRAAEINLDRFTNETKFIQEDIFELNLNGHYNLVTMDCPSILLEKVIEKLLPKVKADLIIMYYGGKGDVKRDERIENQLQLLYKKTYFIRYQLKHACCTSTRTGVDYINYLQKRF